MALVLVLTTSALAACTASSDAVVSTPPTAAVTSPPESSADDLDVQLTTSAASGAGDGELAGSAPSVVAATGGPGAVFVDRVSGDEIVVAMPALLEIGDDPSLAQRFTAMADLGQGRVVVERVGADGTSSIEVHDASGDVVPLGPGTDPVASVGGRWLASANGAEVRVVDVSTGQTVSTLALDGAVDSLAWTPDSATLAAGIDGHVVLIGVTDGELGSFESAAQPVNASWHYPTWLNSHTLAVVEQTLVADPESYSGFVADGPVRLTVTDFELDRQLSSTALDSGVVGADASPDGEAVVLVGTDGIVRWWSNGSTGLLLSGLWTSAAW
jgi:WD40 repeat protein